MAVRPALLGSVNDYIFTFMRQRPLGDEHAQQVLYDTLNGTLERNHGAILVACCNSGHGSDHTMISGIYEYAVSKRCDLREQYCVRCEYCFEPVEISNCKVVKFDK